MKELTASKIYERWNKFYVERTANLIIQVWHSLDNDLDMRYRTLPLSKEEIDPLFDFI